MLLKVLLFYKASIENDVDPYQLVGQVKSQIAYRRFIIANNPREGLTKSLFV